MSGCYPLGTKKQNEIESDVKKLLRVSELTEMQFRVIQDQHLLAVRENQTIFLWLKELDKRLDRIENELFKDKHYDKGLDQA